MRKNEFTTAEDLLKIAREQVLTDQVRVYDEVAVRCLFDELKYRQKRNVKKKSTNHYQDWLYYIAYDGRLARVPNTAKNPSGRRLLKNKTIKYDEWGLLRCNEELTCGQFVRIRPLLEELDPKNHWEENIKERIAKFLEGGKQCKMIIDREFELAYEPEYHDNFCLDGDLVTGESCMSEQGECAMEFYGGIHGCYVCRFENDEGEQVGRCIMYEYNGVRHFIRIYAQRDYARCALRLLRAEMREGDLFGRSEAIPNMCLDTDWDESTHTMYLDGRNYGVNINDKTVVNLEDRHWDLKFDTTSNSEFDEYVRNNDYYRCEYCGEYHESDDGIWIDDEFYCCDDCASGAGYDECSHCGKWGNSKEDGYYTPSGEWCCCEECLESQGYTVCNECGEVIDKDEALEIGYHYYCGEDCARADGWVQCSKCNDWYKEHSIYTNAEGEYLCESCARDEGYELKWVKKPEEKQEQNETEVKND